MLPILAAALALHSEVLPKFAGGALTGVAREATKKLALIILKPCYNVVPLVIRRIWQPPIHNLDATSKWASKGIPVDPRDIPWDVLTTSRFLSYTALAWVVTGGNFWLFKKMNW